MQFETFEQVVSYMEEYTNLEQKTDHYNVRTYRLDRMSSILEKLGNPQTKYKTIHIAGSKGKGSTASYIASGIKALGFKTGLYLSPHVTNIRERFTIDGSFAPENLLIKTGNELKEKLKDFVFENEMGCNCITTFELYTAFAFLLFKNASCQWVIVETGLGGRLDATNIILPQASVLTPIELEHTDILGDTIEKIATEKSKIIKPNTPSFVSYQKPEALEVFKKEAIEKNSKQYYLKDQVKSLNTSTTNEGQKTEIEFSDGFKTSICLKMIGLVQAQNCSLALLVLRSLNLYKPQVTERALENNTLPGRMEKLKFDRPLYVDGAHTVESMKNTLNTFSELYKNKGICIFGCVSGKKYLPMCSLVLEHFDTVVVCRPGTFKKSDPELLFSTFKEIAKEGKTIVFKPEAKDAIAWCKENSAKDTPILACGSFYLAGALEAVL